MTKIFTKGQNDFYDDYFHHPSEIASILDSVKNVYKDRKIISVFEPHRYSRVISLKNQFARCFSKTNIVLLCPTYAQQKKISKFSQLKFAKSISKLSKNSSDFNKKLRGYRKILKKNLIRDEIIIGMGAGIISKWMRELKDIL